MMARLTMNALQEDPICENLPGEKLDPETLRNKVLAHYQTSSGRLNALIKGDELILSWQPPHIDEAAESLHHEAMSLIRSKQYARAGEKWKHAIALNEEDAQYHYQLGLVHFELKQYQDSLESLQKTIALCPIHSKAFLVLGAASLRMRKISDAEMYLLEAVRLDRKSMLAMLHLATVFSIQKKFNEAIDLFEEILKQSPKEIRAYLGLAKIHYILGDFKRSNRYFHQVIELAPGTKMADYAKRSLQVDQSANPELDAIPDEMREEQITEGVQYYISGDFRKAANKYQGYLKLKPSDHYVWYLLGETKIRLGETQEAADCFKKAIRINSKRGLYYKALGAVLHLAGMHAEAVESLKKAIELGKKDPLTRTLYGVNLLRRKKPDAAIEELHAAYKRDPNNPLALYHLALTAIQKNMKSDASDWLQKIKNYCHYTPFMEQADHLIKSIK